jgi:hypothetical protein
MLLMSRTTQPGTRSYDAVLNNMPLVVEDGDKLASSHSERFGLPADQLHAYPARR